MTNNNWEEKLNNIMSSGNLSAEIQIQELIQNLLTKKDQEIEKWKNMSPNSVVSYENGYVDGLKHGDQEHKAELESIKEEIEEIAKKQFIEAFDNDGHRYQIPNNKLQDWFQWSEIPSDDERSWDVPDYAERIDGINVKKPSLKDAISILDNHINKPVDNKLNE